MPPPYGIVSEHANALVLTATARFDDLLAGSWQRVVDYGAGPGSNNILLTQFENTDDMMFSIFQDGMTHNLIVPNAIQQGVPADYAAGVADDGTMWVERDGTLIGQGTGVVPIEDDTRELLIGQSHWAEDTPLVGEVTGFSIAFGADIAPPDETEAEPDETEPEDGPDDEPDEPSPPADPPSDPPVHTTNGDMFIVAHQDDDLLFMNPTIHDQIVAGDPVTTVYVTAGDYGLTEDYWGDRELGEKAAYAFMTGSNDWVDETQTIIVDGVEFDVASSYLADQPDIRLYFLRLPDGFDGGGSDTYGFGSLESLWDGTAPIVATVDGENTYSHAQLTGVLTGLMDLHQPEHLHIQDHTSEHAAIEHSDHLHAAEFATAAMEAYEADFTVTSYVGYASWGLEENLTPEEQALTTQAFAEYAEFDPQTLNAQGLLQEPYIEWTMREYVADSYTETNAVADEPPEEPVDIIPPAQEPEDPAEQPPIVDAAEHADSVEEYFEAIMHLLLADVPAGEEPELEDLPQFDDVFSALSVAGLI